MVSLAGAVGGFHNLVDATAAQSGVGAVKAVARINYQENPTGTEVTNVDITIETISNIFRDSPPDNPPVFLRSPETNQNDEGGAILPFFSLASLKDAAKLANRPEPVEIDPTSFDFQTANFAEQPIPGQLKNSEVVFTATQRDIDKMASLVQEFGSQLALKTLVVPDNVVIPAVLQPFVIKVSDIENADKVQQRAFDELTGPSLPDLAEKIAAETSQSLPYFYRTSVRDLFAPALSALGVDTLPTLNLLRGQQLSNNEPVYMQQITSLADFFMWQNKHLLETPEIQRPLFNIQTGNSFIADEIGLPTTISTAVTKPNITFANPDSTQFSDGTLIQSGKTSIPFTITRTPAPQALVSDQAENSSPWADKSGAARANIAKDLKQIKSMAELTGLVSGLDTKTPVAQRKTPTYQPLASLSEIGTAKPNSKESKPNSPKSLAAAILEEASNMADLTKLVQGLRPSAQAIVINQNPLAPERVAASIAARDERLAALETQVGNKLRENIATTSSLPEFRRISVSELLEIAASRDAAIRRMGPAIPTLASELNPLTSSSFPLRRAS